MSVAYSTWEVASGPTVGYNVGAQGNHCVTEGPSNRMHPQQDTVIRGLSALSIYVQANPEADACGQENRCHREESASSALASSLAPHVTCFDEQSVVSQQREPCALSNSKRLSSRPVTAVVSSLSDDNSRSGRNHGFPCNVWNTHHVSTLDVVSEDRPWENCLVMEDTFEPDSVSSSSSLSDASDAHGDSPCTSGDASQAAVEDSMEAQSPYKGPLDCLSSLPPKKGLSRFYSGKSRSFSCLADVASVKDLAKPDNSYTRKRKSSAASGSNLDRPRLHRTGAVGISKKPPHNSKYTLALAVAMSTKEGSLETEEQDFHASMGVSGRWQSNSAPSRSYSLSDLQRAGNQFSPQ